MAEQYKEVNLPNGQIGRFPATMSNDEIANVLRRQFPAPVSTSQDVAKSFGGGVMRGIEGLVSLPAMAGEALDRLYERVGLIPEGSAAKLAQNDILSTENIGKAFETASGGLTEYQPQTTAGRYAGTTGEFATGLLAGGPASLPMRAATNVVVPAIGSEAAGQLAETIAPDNELAQIGARIAGGVLAPSAFQRVVSPFAGTRQTLQSQAQTLREAGVPVTAGQEVGANRLVRSLEGSMSPSEEQMQALTRAAMSKIGSTADEITAETLNAARSRIGGVFDDVTSSLPRNIDPTAMPVASQLDDIAQKYARLVGSGQKVQVIDNIVARFDDALQGGAQIDAGDIMSWRSDLSALTRSTDPHTRDAAIDALEVIDDLIEANLRATGNIDDVARLSTARQQYRDLLGLESAAGTASSAVAGGLLTPDALRQGIQGQGRAAYVQGQRGDIGELTRAAQSLLKPMPTTLAGGGRAVEGGARILTTGLGSTFGPAGTVAGFFAPDVAGAAVRSRPAQAYLRNQMLSGTDLLTPAQRALLAGVSATQQ